MCRAIDWAIFRKKNNGGKYLEINVGNIKSNIKIIDIANTIKKILPKTKIIKKKKAFVDKRSYKVNFEKYYRLAKYYRPKKNLKTTIKELIKYFKLNKFSKENDFGFYLKRLNLLNEKIRRKIINKNLEYLE